MDGEDITPLDSGTFPPSWTIRSRNSTSSICDFSSYVNDLFGSIGTPARCTTLLSSPTDSENSSSNQHLEGLRTTTISTNNIHVSRNIRFNSPNLFTMARHRPRFMSPTMASRAQQVTPQPQSRNATPSSSVSKDESGRGWMSSAARKVGLSSKKRSLSVRKYLQ